MMVLFILFLSLRGSEEILANGFEANVLKIVLETC